MGIDTMIKGWIRQILLYYEEILGNVGNTEVDRIALTLSYTPAPSAQVSLVSEATQPDLLH